MTTTIFDSARETSPLRWLLIATLAAIALALGVSMAMVTQSQVRKAEAHYAAERTAAASAAPASASKAVAPTAQRATAGGVMNVGYLVNR